MNTLHKYLEFRRGILLNDTISTAGLYEAYCRFCKKKKETPLPLKEVEKTLDREIKHTKILWENLATFRGEQYIEHLNITKGGLYSFKGQE